MHDVCLNSSGKKNTFTSSLCSETSNFKSLSDMYLQKFDTFRVVAYGTRKNTCLSFVGVIFLSLVVVIFGRKITLHDFPRKKETDN